MSTELTSCPVPVWDGPYRMRCALTLIDGKCARHGAVSAKDGAFGARDAWPEDVRAALDEEGKRG